MSGVAELRSSQKKKHEATGTNGAWCVANQAIALYSRDFFGSFFYLEKNEQNFYSIMETTFQIDLSNLDLLIKLDANNKWITNK